MQSEIEARHASEKVSTASGVAARSTAGASIQFNELLLTERASDATGQPNNEIVEGGTLATSGNQVVASVHNKDT